jgi:hypothetical protein
MTPALAHHLGNDRVRQRQRRRFVDGDKAALISGARGRGSAKLTARAEICDPSATTSSSSIDSGEQTRLIPRSSTEIHRHLRDDLGYTCGVIGALGHYMSVSIR